MRGALNCATVQKTESTEVFTVNSVSNTDLNGIKRRDIEAQTHPQACMQRRSYCWMISIDLPIVLLILILIGLFELSVIPSHKSGFFCNDPALSYPFNGDTVSTAVLMTSILIGPVVIFILTETVFTDADTVDSRVSQTLRTSACLYRSYLFGLAVNLCIVEVMKGFVGGLRPTFFDLCQPDTAVNCTGSEYVDNFECKPSDKYTWWLQMDSFRSFPSGHTSCSIYCGFFIVWYLQKRAFDWRHQTVLLVPFIQLIFVSFAAISSLTRVTDHRHHWWDVLAGAVVGIVVLVYTIRCLCENFSYIRSRDSKMEDTQKLTRNILYDTDTVRS